jgi:orotate phosphoribosyltransferase
MLSQKEILSIFKETKAFMTGHFRLSSGLHSGHYLQCALVMQYPDCAEKLCRELAGRFAEDKPTIVIGPAMGGVLVAYEVARHLNCRAIFTEREAGAMKLRRAFKIGENDRILVVEDVVTTGGSTNEVIRLVKQSKATIVGVGALVDRSGQNVDFGYKLETLLNLDIEIFKPQDCPLCEEGMPLSKPGSRRFKK